MTEKKSDKEIPAWDAPVRPEHPVVEPEKPPKPTQLPADSSKDKEKEKEKHRSELVKKMADIEKEYGQPSNIPMTHEYWQLKQQLQGVDAK